MFSCFVNFDQYYLPRQWTCPSETLDHYHDYRLKLHVVNGFSHPYPLDESIFIFRGIRSNFSFLFHFSIKIMSANRIAP